MISVIAMKTNTCRYCGRTYRSSYDTDCCPECSAVHIPRSSVHLHPCKECGREFYGGNAAKYCPECREKRSRQRVKDYLLSTYIRKECPECGKEYIGTRRRKYCPDCTLRLTTCDTFRPKPCIKCGAEFPGAPAEKYCQKCLAEYVDTPAANALREKYREMGSVAKCDRCGRDYFVESPSQRYCPECMDDAARERAQQNAREHYDSRPRKERSPDKPKRPSSGKNLVGRKYGDVEILSVYDQIGSQTVFNCRCGRCGRTFKLGMFRLYKDPPVVDCGCSSGKYLNYTKPHKKREK